MTIVGEGNEVLLFLDNKRTYKVKVEKGKEFHTHRGYIELEKIIGREYGTKVTSNLGVGFYILRPLVRDFIKKTDRRTQVLYPKDIGYIILQLGIGSGSIIVEAGTGSGALTMALANAVRPDGRVYSYEINPCFQKVAIENVERAGLIDFVKFRLGDITEGIIERGVDAVVLDLATPWLVVEHAWESLTGSGVFVSFSPTIEQVMKTVREVESQPFIELETVELILRKITVAENKTRPQTRMIGHSGYLTTARKVMYD